MCKTPLSICICSDQYLLIKSHRFCFHIYFKTVRIVTCSPCLSVRAWMDVMDAQGQQSPFFPFPSGTVPVEFYLKHLWEFPESPECSCRYELLICKSSVKRPSTNIKGRLQTTKRPSEIRMCVLSG